MGDNEMKAYTGADSGMAEWSDDSALVEPTHDNPLGIRMVKNDMSLSAADVMSMAKPGSVHSVPDDGSAAHEPVVFRPGNVRPGFTSYPTQDADQGHGLSALLTKQGAEIGNLELDKAQLMCRIAQLERENKALRHSRDFWCDVAHMPPNNPDVDVSHETPAAFPANALKHSR